MVKKAFFLLKYVDSLKSLDAFWKIENTQKPIFFESGKAYDEMIFIFVAS